MVNSRELRIGNKLLFEGQIVEVMAIDEIRAKPDLGAAIGIKYLNYGEVDYIGKWAANLDYVPLTVELLGQLEFRIDSITTREHTRFGIVVITTNFIIEDENMCFFEVDKIESEKGISYYHKSKGKIEFLHELQNIHFITKNVELEVNLPQPA